MKVYFVEWEEFCEECGGSGVEQNPEWADYWAETNGHRHLPLEDQMAADDAWWAVRGYPGGHWPPEEVNCDFCYGAGIRRGRVSLADALDDLGKR